MSHYKPYPEYKDSGVEWIGEVPAHWEVVPGKALFIEKKRKNTDLAGGDYLSLVAGRGVIPYEEKGDIGNRKPDDLDRCKLVEPGDHVINSMNFSIGAYGRSRFSGVCSPVYVILGENDRKLGEGFGELILRNPSYQDFIQSFGSGILDHRRSIGWDEIKVAHVPCPPVQEQEEISALVHRETTRIDTLVEKKQRFIELLEEKRQAVITQAVTKGLDPNVPMKDSGVEWIGEVPEHWEKCQLKNLAAVCNGRDYKTVEDPGGQYPVIGSGGQFAWASECLYDGESVLFGRKGTIDKPLYINGPFWTVDTMFYTSLSKRAIGKYIYYVATIIPYESLSTNTALPSMTQEDLSSLNLTVPDTAEQSQIATFLDRETTRVDTLIEKTRESIELLKERRAALITAAVTGKIDVREETA
jgi:type I restriction enzyme S subunit